MSPNEGSAQCPTEGTNCMDCVWCKKAGFFNSRHCFAPCFRAAEPIHDWMGAFIGAVGCKSFIKKAGEAL